MMPPLITIALHGMALCDITAVYSYTALCLVSINTLMLVWAILAPLILFYLAIFSKLGLQASSLLAKFAVISGVAALLTVPVYVVAYVFFPDMAPGFAINYAFSLLLVLLVAIIKSSSVKK